MKTFLQCGEWKKDSNQETNMRVEKFPCLIFILLLMIVMVPDIAPAAEEKGFDDAIEGFEEDTDPKKTTDSDDEMLEGFEEDDRAAEPQETERVSQPSRYQIDGYFKIGASYNFAHHHPETGQTDWRGLSRLQTALQIDLSAKFSDRLQALVSVKGFYDFAYKIKGQRQFTDDLRDAYESEVEWRDTYVLASPFKNLDIKLGRQIVVWGKSDFIRVTDVLNPLDLREPGLTDLEDLRLPLAMARIDYYVGDWSVTAIAIPEIRFNKTPEFGSDFYPQIMPLPHEDRPDSGGDNTELALAINGIFSGWDISFYWADVYNDLPHAALKSVNVIGPPLFPPMPFPELELQHARLKMYGTALNVAYGEWLFKAEAAYLRGFTFFNFPGRTFSRTDLYAGVEYAGFSETTIAVEAVHRHINHFREELAWIPDEAVENEFQWILFINRTFFNEALSVTFVATTFGLTGEDGAFQRLSAEYDLTDNIKLIGGIVLYQSGDLSVYRNIGDNDRVFFEIKYSF
jgi:hypothetical protein